MCVSFRADGTSIVYIYNLKPDYQKYIRRNYSNTIQKLVYLAEEYEIACRKTKTYKSPSNPAQAHFPVYTGVPVELTNKKKTACWRCRQKGHMRYYCKNYQQYYVFCGIQEDGVSKAAATKKSRKLEMPNIIATTIIKLRSGSHSQRAVKVYIRENIVNYCRNRLMKTKQAQ